jgi:hypothetical protein
MHLWSAGTEVDQVRDQAAAALGCASADETALTPSTAVARRVGVPQAKIKRVDNGPGTWRVLGSGFALAGCGCRLKCGNRGRAIRGLCDLRLGKSYSVGVCKSRAHHYGFALAFEAGCGVGAQARRPPRGRRGLGTPGGIAVRLGACGAGVHTVSAHKWLLAYEFWFAFTSATPLRKRALVTPTLRRRRLRR